MTFKEIHTYVLSENKIVYFKPKLEKLINVH